jgi:serine phosphatase RsbU (regulator of sigma subunit)/anti-sigma regulatory factor (Ser/Thr protein kinase)/TolA-binding protein
LLSKVEKEQLKVPAHIDYLGDLRDFVTQIGKKHSFSDKVINAFKLAVDEAATNIIRHAYRETDGLITLRSIVRKNSLTLCIIDQGTYFDPKRVKDPDLNRYIDIGKKGGLGIFIIRKLMDEIDYRKTEEGNELRITKYLEKPVKERLANTVSTIPVSIKAKFFFRAIAIITLIIALGYLYYYLKASDLVLNDFLNSSRSTSSQIVNRISTSIAAGEFGFIEDAVHPIYEDYKNQLHLMSVEDSTGIIVYSSNLGDIFGKFNRPSQSEPVEEGVYKYSLDEVPVYEFESDIVIRSSGKRYGRAHIIHSAEGIYKQIASNRINDLKLTLFILGLSYIGVSVIIYLLMNPLRKLSTWVKDLGHGEISDEIDIDTSSELGEIAQAFSDITHKFRESQKNLVDQERLQKEMQLAQDIQQTLLPMSFPELDGYELASYYEAAKEVGGDYYDFVEVDKDTLGIAVADVSGKGVPGSLVMTMIRTALRTEARGMKDAAEVLTRVNDFISNDIKKGMFVTVFYLIIDSKRRSINYASAGHNPMILYRNSTQKTYYLNPKGFPIGIQLPEKDLFRRSIESETIELTKDDILLLYTDGITEAMNPNRELFGEERLQDVLRNNGHMPVKDFVEKLKLSIYSFTEGTQQYDDITLVAVKEESSREADELRRAKEAHKLIAQGVSIREACEQVNLTTYAYYNKYKKVFEEEGVDAIEVGDEAAVEAKHLSIEEKTKILDIISQHPEYGAGRISEELATEKYGFEKIGENKIYDELVRSRLNTRALREAYIQRIKSGKRRLKPPGTPLMTLDGRLIIGRKDDIAPPRQTTPPAVKQAPTKPERIESKPEETKPERLFDDSFESLLSAGQESAIGDASFETEANSLLEVPLDELLAKNRNSYEDIPPTVDETAEEAEPAEPIGESASINGEESLHEMFGDSRSSDEEESVVDGESSMATDDLESTEVIAFDDLSFQNYFSEGSGDEKLEDDFEEPEKPVTTVEDDSQPAFEELIAAANENDLNLGEQSPSQFEEEGDENFLMSSAVDELLAEDSEQAFVDEDSVEGATEETNGRERDDASFADLIQAIDDEIVYIPEDSREKTGKAKKKHKSRNGGAELEPIGKLSHLLSEREKVLIKGIRFYKSKEYLSAIFEFKKVLKEHPDYKEAHSILGNAYFRNQMFNEAASSYEKVKELDPNDITAYENLGVIYANRGEYKQAVGEWKRVLELNPERVDIKEKIKKAMRMMHA